MAQASKTFRVFVSSTFSDLKAERNALQQYVFPRLRELCTRHGCRFQAIDLRWGVSEEAGLDQQTMKICLKEIARCQEVTPRPNFIVLLGDRYGWRPLPAEIPADEFETIKTNLTSDDFTLLERFYLLDENALYRRGARNAPVGLYCLQRRKVNERDGVTDEDREASREAEAAEWHQTESQLRRSLLHAIASLDLRDGELAKYHASATEQEIMRGVMNVPDAERHVSCYFRSLRSENDRPLSEDLPGDNAVKDFIDLNEDLSFDGDASDAGDKLRDLKGRLRRQVGTNVHEYNAHWLSTGAGESESPITLEHIGTLLPDLDECLQLLENERAPSLLCVDVWRRLARVIVDEIAQIEGVPQVQREKEEHQKFGVKRARHFRGRALYLDAIQQYVAAGDQHTFALWGESGSGKSALLARAAERIHEANPNAELVIRFIGATPQSSEVRALLESLCHEISGLYGAEQETIPSDYNGLTKEFPKRLALATEQKPLVLVLDALDQLSEADHGRNLTWLPAKLPENVRLIVSTIPGECLTALQRKVPAESILRLEAMAKDEGSEVLDLWLRDVGRTLQDDQRAEVLNKFAIEGLPLYLKLAFEEARLWHSYDGASLLAPDVPGIISKLFARLSNEANHGPVMVSRSLGYLAAARNGLTEDEILAVLSRDMEVMREFKRRSVKSPDVDALPAVIWSRLYFDLEPYLTERNADNTSLLSFYHRQLGAVTTQQYLGADDKQRAHKHLADYFGGQDYWLETPEQHRNRVGEFATSARRANLRKAVEFPWQLRQSGDWDRLEHIHTNLDFLESKTATGLVFELAQDFTRALKIMPSERPFWRVVHLLEEALRREIYFIARHCEDYPPALFQCLWNSCWWYDCPQAAAHYKETDGPWSRDGAKLYQLLEEWRTQKELETPDVRWLRSLRPPPQHLGTAQIAILKGHENGVNGVAVSADCRRIVSGSTDKTVRVWDIETGEELKMLKGHEDWVTSVTMTADGRWIVSGSRDNAVWVWDTETGEKLRVLKGHDGAVSSVAISADGRRIVSGSEDKTIRIWDMETGEELQVLTGHEGAVLSVAISADRRRLVSGSWGIGTRTEPSELTGDKTIRVWDMETGEELRVLKGHEGPVLSVAISADGRQIVSGSYDQTVRVWNIETGEELRVRKGHEGAVSSVAISADGRRIVSGGSWDKTVRIWDMETGGELEFLKGHEHWVTSVSISADSRRIVSGSHDQTVRIWDMETGEELKVLKGHDHNVSVVAISADSRWIVSGGNGDKTVRIWDIETGGELKVLEGHGVYGVNTVAISPDSRLVVSGSSDKTVRIWDVETGAEPKVLKGHEGFVLSVAISADSRLVVSGSDDKTVRIWDMETSEELKVLKGHEDWVRSVAISADGRWIVTGSDDNTVRIWDMKIGEQIRVLKGHEGAVMRVAISADSLRIVSGSKDTTLRIWDMETGDQLQILEGTAADVQAIADPNIFPLRALSQISETSVEDAYRKILAFFPESLYRADAVAQGHESLIKTHPDGTAWTAAIGNYLCIIKVDGGTELSE